ncbi:hypothetical protein BDZ94DRAFT_1304984 [Collybia nuda]|uniref:Uncharacterized protein n=1 Tax=Collybia nuda TaxID=64659 RepID=A0A9P5YF80_9AGAR|nr:hypothetical protein BDZ94DRAFT_1304984 [Collybia nuda]
MGIDAGFDLYPPLTDSDVDKCTWEAFLEEVKNEYQSDSAVTIDTMGRIEFTVGEHPTLSKHGHLFRRFSSKISGSHAQNVEVYLHEVGVIATRYFGYRIHHWSELSGGGHEIYGWKEVHAASAAERALED